MFQVTFNKNEDSGIYTLTLSGECFFGEKGKVNTLLSETLPESPQRLIIDLSSCSYLDSSGIGILAAYYSRLKEKNADARVAVVVGRSSYLIRKLGNLGIFSGSGIEIFKSTEEAAAFLL